MLAWTQETAAFLQTAAEKTEYYKKVAALLAQKLPEARTVCDAGCGIGALSLELARHFEGVTAADRDPQAMAFLRKRLAERGTENVICLEGDLSACEPAEKYDAMVFCYFGRTAEILSIAKKQCRGRIAIIKKNYRFHRFSTGQRPVSDETADDCAEILDRLGIPHTWENYEFECGQPFRNAEEAVRFFLLYDRGSGAALTPENIERQLERTDDPDYPFYLPKKKAVGMFIMRVEDLP